MRKGRWIRQLRSEHVVASRAIVTNLFSDTVGGSVITHPLCLFAHGQAVHDIIHRDLRVACFRCWLVCGNVEVVPCSPISCSPNAIAIFSFDP